METQALRIEIRSSRGKGAARQLRMAGRLPAVVYGPGTEPTAVSVVPRELRAALSTEFGRNVLLDLELGDEKVPAIVKDLQVHPVGRQPLHVDFLRVDPEAPVTVRVPLETYGRSKGVAAGGDMNVVFYELPLTSVPAKIPAAIRVDVTDLDINDSISVKDLPLPEGTRVELPPERTVIMIEVERRRPVEGEEEAAAVVAGEAAPAQAAAPEQGEPSSGSSES